VIAVLIRFGVTDVSELLRRGASYLDKLPTITKGGSNMIKIGKCLADLGLNADQFLEKKPGDFYDSGLKKWISCPYPDGPPAEEFKRNYFNDKKIKAEAAEQAAHDVRRAMARAEILEKERSRARAEHLSYKIVMTPDGTTHAGGYDSNDGLFTLCVAEGEYSLGSKYNLVDCQSCRKAHVRMLALKLSMSDFS
jgi:hypothetical protein